MPQECSEKDVLGRKKEGREREKRPSKRRKKAIQNSERSFHLIFETLEREERKTREQKKLELKIFVALRIFF